MPEKPINSDQQRPEKSLKTYARYAGIGFQMFAVVGLFTFIGYQLDKKSEADMPLMTALFSLAGVCIALYQVIKTVTKK